MHAHTHTLNQKGKPAEKTEKCTAADWLTDRETLQQTQKNAISKTTTLGPVRFTDLHDCGLQLLRVGNPLGQQRLREFADQGHEVAHAVSAVGRGGD